MTDIQFEEEQQYRQLEQAGQNQKPLFVRLMLKTGIVSTDRAAEYVLLGVAILGIVATGIYLFTGGTTAELSDADIGRIIQLQQGARPPAQ